MQRQNIEEVVPQSHFESRQLIRSFNVPGFRYFGLRGKDFPFYFRQGNAQIEEDQTAVETSSSNLIGGNSDPIFDTIH